MSLICLLKGTGPNGFGYATTAKEVTEGLDLSGKTMLLTGCTSGLGRETLRVLALRGAHILAAGRTRERAQQACAGLEQRTMPVPCDLADPASLRACIEFVKRHGRPLDAIICNAGIMALPRLQQAFGYELQFFTNHIGHFILVTRLLDRVAPNGRVVIVSSAVHTAAPSEGIQFDNLSGSNGYQPWKAYGQSKLANLLFARELAQRLDGTDKTANALHPGVIKTNLARHMGGLVNTAMAIVSPLVLKTAAQGAATQCYLAAHPAVAGISGKYFADCNETASSPLGADAGFAERLWRVSEEIASKVLAE